MVVVVIFFFKYITHYSILYGMVKVAFLIAPAASSMKPVFYREIVQFSEDNLQMTIIA